MRASLVAVLLLEALVGCGKRSSDPGPSATSREVTGTITVDGTPLTVASCRPGRDITTYVEALTSAGVLRFEDRQLFWSADPMAIARGEVLTCEQLDRSWGGGTRADGTAYWRGTLVFRCKAGARSITGDLKLDCGNITAEERAQLDHNRQELRDEQTQQRDGAGSSVAP
ncbi:MAG: hypothetical protein JWP01_1777 [Myxococcales bacterium]|nr:hypothetical protein [Myxococcales bacterium]